MDKTTLHMIDERLGERYINQTPMGLKNLEQVNNLIDFSKAVFIEHSALYPFENYDNLTVLLNYGTGFKEIEVICCRDSSLKKIKEFRRHKQLKFFSPECYKKSVHSWTEK
ncbi:MAG: hypothetical protein ACK4NC_00790 [Candidatus Gracilibacteria bacterium]